MTSSKSDLEAKEGQIPNESNFLEFVSLLGSLSTRAGGSSTQDNRGSQPTEEAEAAQEGESRSCLFNRIFDLQAEEKIDFGTASSVKNSTVTQLL